MAGVALEQVPDTWGHGYPIGPDVGDEFPGRGVVAIDDPASPSDNFFLHVRELFLGKRVPLIVVVERVELGDGGSGQHAQPLPKGGLAAATATDDSDPVHTPDDTDPDDTDPADRLAGP
jgi:hypothetical protein